MFVYVEKHFPPLPPGPFARAGGSVFGKVRSAVDALKATARALDPACIDGHDAASLFDAVSEGERVCGAMKALLARLKAEIARSGRRRRRPQLRTRWRAVVRTSSTTAFGVGRPGLAARPSVVIILAAGLARRRCSR
jgi:hypothetical protein